MAATQSDDVAHELRGILARAGLLRASQLAVRPRAASITGGSATRASIATVTSPAAATPARAPATLPRRQAAPTAPSQPAATRPPPAMRDLRPAASSLLHGGAATHAAAMRPAAPHAAPPLLLAVPIFAVPPPRPRAPAVPGVDVRPPFAAAAAAAAAAGRVSAGHGADRHGDADAGAARLTDGEGAVQERATELGGLASLVARLEAQLSAATSGLASAIADTREELLKRVDSRAPGTPHPPHPPPPASTEERRLAHEDARAALVAGDVVPALVAALAEEVRSVRRSVRALEADAVVAHEQQRRQQLDEAGASGAGGGDGMRNSLDVGTAAAAAAVAVVARLAAMEAHHHTPQRGGGGSGEVVNPPATGPGAPVAAHDVNTDAAGSSADPSAVAGVAMGGGLGALLEARLSQLEARLGAGGRQSGSGVGGVGVGGAGDHQPEGSVRAPTSLSPPPPPRPVQGWMGSGGGGGGGESSGAYASSGDTAPGWRGGATGPSAPTVDTHDGAPFFAAAGMASGDRLSSDGSGGGGGGTSRPASTPSPAWWGANPRGHRPLSPGEVALPQPHSGVQLLGGRSLSRLQRRRLAGVGALRGLTPRGLPSWGGTPSSAASRGSGIGGTERG